MTDRAASGVSAPGARWKTRLVGVGMAALFAVIGLRAASLSLAGAPELRADAAQAAAARRADILDRNGELLATSVSVYSLYADPRAVWDAAETVEALSGVFPDLKRDRLVERLSDRERAFVWIRRGLTPRQRQAVFQLGLEGLGFRTEVTRAYPNGRLAGHVLGHANVHGRGLAGVEFALDNRLSGDDAPLRLTLESGVQFALEAELDDAARRYEAIGAAGVVLEAETGAVRALASWPPVDPNRWPSEPAEVQLDRAVGAPIELGSIFKPFTVAVALEAGVVAPSQRFDLSQPVIVAGKEFDDHHAPARNASLTDIIADSSNRGVVRIALDVGARRQREFLDRLGLLERAPLELAASSAPIRPAAWDELSLSTVSFGHGISVSPIAFASAFSAFANGGEVVRPTLLEDGAAGDRAPRRAMAAPTAALVTAMMRETVVRGTATRADVAGYRVAGKTGTAEKVVDAAYAEDLNVTSFAALFPADDPKYVVLIVLDEPKAVEGGATAAWNAAPVAGRVIERIAPLLGVAPVFDSPVRTDSPSARGAADRRSL
ncbi:MAG: penicillin-binding protein 2 [Pseudomonadota bacterium]